MRPTMIRLAGGLLLALSALAHAQEGPAASPSPAPEAALEVPEPIFDAGKVDRGTVVKHTFTLKNRGATELSIDAKPG
jgi:hypothetical protein